MKRLTLILILLLSLGVLMACNNEAKTPQVDKVSEAERLEAERLEAEEQAAKEAEEQAAKEAEEKKAKAAAARAARLKEEEEKARIKAEEEAAEAKVMAENLLLAQKIGKEAASVTGYVEPEDPDNPFLPAKVTSFGRSTLKIEFNNGLVMYIDPYAGTKDDYAQEADLVLVTHQHGDHNQIGNVTLKEGGKIVQCPDDMVEGDTLEVFGITLTAVPAYNGNHDREECCGYLIQFGEMTLYHAGDTSYIEEMVDLVDAHIDFAFLPMDGFYNMDAEEAKRVADTILAEVVIPIHTDHKGRWNQEHAEEFQAENKILLKPRKSFIIE